MGARQKPLTMSTDLIEKLAEVLGSTKSLRRVKIRGIVVDIDDEYDNGRTRVRLVGGRSRWDTSITISKITRL